VSLAVLEALAHSAVLPSDMVLVIYDIPDASALGAWPVATLPADWANYPAPASTQSLGNAWAAAGTELAVRVPSAVVRLEDNWLLNPAHPAMRTVKASVLGAFVFDARLRG